MDLSLTKTPNVSSVPTGGGIQYTLTYANVGNQNTTGTVITETLPAGTTFDSAHSTPGAWVQQDATHYTDSIGNVAGGGAGGSAIFAVTVTAASGTINNTAIIASSATDLQWRQQHRHRLGHGCK